ncbi:MAG: (2Fe-2S)-binding protein [Rhizobiales bacterium]|jgi:carbon-monoxide dehydrogenase small subunit|nr:(2Fe-2S)-binding protein [Hyphomicrobiales bacterium]
MSELDHAQTTRHISVTVNGTVYERDVLTRTHLGDFLRQELGLTGTHLGCEHGVCGACTIILDGQPIRSCLMLAVQANGATIRTIEGLAQADGTLHPVQEAFWDKHGLQCGFCTPGMVTTLAAVLEADPTLDETTIREAISGNICRCTGYETIVDAALQAASRMRGDH